MKKALLAVALFAVFCAVPASDFGWKFRDLTGTYALTSENVLYPAPTEKKDRVVLMLDGDAARDTYQNMVAKEQPDVCGSTMKTKTTGPLQCSWDPDTKEYACAFAILLKNGEAVPAVPC